MNIAKSILSNIHVVRKNMDYIQVRLLTIANKMKLRIEKD